jgi:uncharacterized caspase-like protein/WD40 repeat protein
MRKLLNPFFLILFSGVGFHSVAQQPELIIPSGHMFQVKGAFYSEKEKYIVTWSENIKIWEAATGKLVKNIEHSKRYPNEVQLLDDNETLVAAYDDSVVFRNINEDRVIRSFAGNNFRISEKANAFVLMEYDDNDASRTKNAKLYDLRTFRLKHVFTNPVAAASETGTYASVDISNTDILDSAFNVIYTVKQGTMVGISGDFSLLALQYDSTIDIVNVYTKKVLHTIHTGKYDVYSLKLLPKDNRVLVKVTPQQTDHGYLMQNGNSYFYAMDLTTFKVINKFPEQKANLETWDHSDGFIAASFTDSTIRVWDIISGKLIVEFKDPDGHSNEIYLSGSKKFLLSSSNASSAKAWDIRNKRLQLKLEDNTSYLKEIQFSSTGKLAFVQREEDIWIWDTEKGKPVFNKTAEKDRRTWYWSVSKDERLLYRITRKYYQTRLGEGNSFYLTDEDSNYFRLEVYDTRSGTLLSNTPLPEKIYRQAVSPDGNTLLLGISDSSLLALNIKTGKITATYKLRSTPDDISYTADGSQFIVVADNQFTIYNSKTFTREYGFEERSRLSTYGYDPSTGIAVLALNNQALIVRDVKQNKLLYEYGGTQKKVNNSFNKEVYRVLFDRTGKYAYVKSIADSIIIGIDLETGGTQKSIRLRSYTADMMVNSRNNLLLSSTGYLSEWSIAGDSVIGSREFDVEEINGLQPSEKLLLGHQGSELKIFDNAKATLLHSVFFLPEGNYIVTDAGKRFDGTEEARKRLYFSCGTEIIELDQVKDQLWVPNLAERIIKGEAINAPKIGQLGICGLTPLVDSKEEKDNYQFFITPRKGGLGETVLYVNGIEVKRYNISQLSKAPAGYSLNVPKASLQSLLATGKDNQVLLKAFTKDNNISSRGLTITLASKSKDKTLPNLYAVMVGVSDYKGEELDLKYAAKDAQDLSNALSASARKLLNTDGKEHVFMYNINTGAERTAFPEKQSIKQVFGEIGGKAKPNDILMVFFAGHGVMAGEKKQFYFLTADASKNSDVTATGISISELNEWMKPSVIKAQKRVLVFDACNSGQAINDLVTIGNKEDKYVAARNDDESNRIKAVEKLNERSGMFILSAAASNQFAYELGKYSQGVLTYSLLKAIKEQPDILDDGKYLNVDKWFAAAEKTVTDIVSQTGNRQNPQKFGSGGFNVGLIDKDVMAGIVLPNEKPLFTSSNFQNNDEAVAYDDLELSKQVNQQLNEVSVRGIAGKVSFVTASNSPDAYTLGGRYDIKGEDVSVRVNIIHNKKIVHRFEVRGKVSALNVLAAMIVEKVEGWANDGR